jgi:hypothetical protein
MYMQKGFLLKLFQKSRSVCGGKENGGGGKLKYDTFDIL